MSQGKRANDNGPNAAGYQLGDLEIVRTGRVSGEQPRVPSPPPSPPQRRETAAANTARGIPRNLTLADGDMGPALELDIDTGAGARGSLPQTGRASATNLAPVAAPARASQAQAAAVSFGDSALDDFDDGSFAKLPSLDVVATPARSAERVSVRESAPEATPAKQREEHETLLALADFGPAPRSLLASVPYAVHVGRRLFTLRKQRGQAQDALRAQLTEHHTALVAMGKALMALAGDARVEPLRAAFMRVQEESTKLQHADQGVSRTREGNERALNLLRSEAEHLKEQLAPYLAAEQTALGAQRKAEEEVRRAQAMQKRAEIELRALEGATTAVDSAKLEALTSQVGQRRAALEALAPNLAQATEALGKARRDLALARGSLDANEEKQRLMEAEARARESEAEGHKQAANGAHELALSELAEAAKQQKLSALVPESSAHAANTERAVEQAVGVLSNFDRALTLYDRDGLVRGIVLMAGGVAALIALLLLR